MDKKDFIFGEVKAETFTYNGQLVEVIPYLSYEEMKTLTHVYILELFGNSDTIGGNVITAELSILANILDLKTNVKMYAEDGKTVLTIDQLLSNMDLYINTVQAIKNYNLFREFLDKAVEGYKFQKTLDVSLGRTLQTISTKLINLIDTLTSFEPTDENIARIKTLAEEINQYPVFKEAVSIFKNGASEKKKPSRRKSS